VTGDRDRELDAVRAFLATRDEAAFRVLYRSQTPALYALALRLAGGDAREAEELVQEGWTRAVRLLATFRGESRLRTWLAGLVVNVRRERIRAVWRDAPLSEVEPAASVDGDAVVDLERSIASLPAGARDVFVLHDVEGYTHEEIAAMLGIVAGTSKSQLARARRLLRQALAGGRSADAEEMTR
jgi:RNA polymerase sigma-70 factor, ECF subfamily